MISFEYTYRSSTYKVEGVPLIANGQLTFTGEIMLSNMGEDTFDMDLGTRSLWSDLLNFTVNLSDGNLIGLKVDFHLIISLRGAITLRTK